MSDAGLEHGGRWWVPGNRWDLIADRVGAGPRRRTAVIVTHFEQPESLARMYAALADLDPGCFELVVTDDGSRTPPAPPPADFAVPVTVVRQEDHGCRPGAARNLGVAATTCANLVFLDADTVPAPSTVARLAAWPDIAPDVLVVGRRGHVDLTGWSPQDTMDWLGGRRRPPPRRPDPAWLDAGFRETRNLLDADDRSYRFVISAVMACGRALFDDVAGFDPSRDEYGGDDWEFASRAFNNGAVLVHDPTALAWHDEPDWAQRDGGGKDDETLWLASVITEPLTRGRGVIHAFPDTLVELATTAESGAGEVVAIVADLLRDVPDARIHLTGPLPRWADRHLAHDPRVTTDPPTPLQRLRARHTLTTAARWRWPPAAVLRLLARLGGGADSVEVVDDADRVVAAASSTRSLGRRRRAGGAPIDDVVLSVRIDAAQAGLVPLDPEFDLAAAFRRDAVLPASGDEVA